MGQFLSLAKSIMRQDQAQGYAQVQATAASVLAELKLRPERFGDLRGLTPLVSGARRHSVVPNYGLPSPHWRHVEHLTSRYGARYSKVQIAQFTKMVTGGMPNLDRSLIQALPVFSAMGEAELDDGSRLPLSASWRRPTSPLTPRCSSPVPPISPFGSGLWHSLD
jgi:hypothetical protein